MVISVSTFAQFAGNADLLIPTKSGSKPLLGVSATYLYDIDNGLAIGGNVGVRMSLVSGVRAFQFPFMADVRYYVGGDNYGFYPEALLGFVHSRSSTTGAVKIKASSTNFAYAIGAGYKIDQSIDISARYESITYSIGSSNAIGIRVGFWF